MNCIEYDKLLETIDKILLAIGKQIPKYMLPIEDSVIVEGNVAVCIVDEEG